jgi:hypothetical protein
MKNEFIPYEQAIALKKLGFDEPCIALYNKECKTIHLNLNLVNKKPYFCAPLYQQAFRWFREKYNLDSFVKHLYKSTIKVGYYFGIDQYKGVEFQMDFDAWYDTYEEAELACLKKLIELSTETNKP